ncbi:IPT/TIG domain-containing protein [Pontibacter sp. BT731]|uniref:DUF7619 domain-containing protein n=1 Tax=Pontibacter coccineus TaxID=3063328 RepID=UPI0026E3BD52|nr:IPT/TIG domain-containing protein [Pontibacter sp. BT731]MDO6388766.1 IPT/TIG domain-containing protein [Pontibacter sp. BT731]
MRTTLLLLISFFFICIQSNAQIANFDLYQKVGITVGLENDIAVDSEGNIYLPHQKLQKFTPEGRVIHKDPLCDIDFRGYNSYRIAFDAKGNLYALSYSVSKLSKYNKEGKLLFEIGTRGKGPGQFSYPNNIKVNSKEEIFVADSGNGRIQKFDKEGNFLQEIPLVTGSISLDAHDNLFALDVPNKRIIKYSPQGEQLLVFGNSEDVGTRLNGPVQLDVDKKTGQVYVFDNLINGYGYKGFLVFDANGNFETKSILDSGPGRLMGSSHLITVNHEGNILIVDQSHQIGNSQIFLYDKKGQYLDSWGREWSPKEITLDEDDNIYIINSTGKVTKFDHEGEVVMEFGYAGSGWSISAPSAISVDIFGNIYVLNSYKHGNAGNAIFKFNSKGQFQQRFTDFGDANSENYFTDLAHDAAGNMYVTDYYSGVVRKISPQGKFITKIGSRGPGPGQLWVPQAVAVDLLGIIHVLDYKGTRIQQFDATGKFIREFGKYSSSYISWDVDSDLALDGKGNIYVASNIAGLFQIFNAKGELQHEEKRSLDYVSANRSGSRLILGGRYANTFTIYQSSDYQEPKSLITGFVYHDTNSNCTLDTSEQTLAGIVVQAMPGPVYGVTRADGRYQLKVDPGNYSLQTILPDQIGRKISATCPQPGELKNVAITRAGEIVDAINFGNRVALSPYLSVSVSSTRRRRCFESTTTVHYINSGFATAPDAKVYLQLPGEVALLSADKPYTLLSNGTYEFSVGDLSGGQSGTITIRDIVTCGDESVRGRTVCTRAWITPSNNKPAEPTPTVSITGRCNAELGMIRFVVRNTGTADMDQHELFRKFANGELASQEQFRLAAGDSLVLWVPSLGYTWRLEADQPDGNGDNTTASVTIEGCPSEAASSVSTGMVNLLPTDDEEAEKSEECMPITDSYDPNDKLVTPVGRTEEFYTPTNTALKYKIRFQNTGTDVAYRIVVVDTLSEHLDLSTLQLGATSHPSRVEVSGKGQPVLTWTFDNIMLPDSTANEPGSHGYVQFSIKPKVDLAEKTLVENFADIFFDFNSPIRTNVTQNRIFDMPPVINEAVRVNLEDVLATPGIAAFVPSAGKFGSEVTISGKRFASVPADNKVYFEGKVATVVSSSATELKVLVPAGATSGALQVITPDGGVTSTTKFQVYQPPVLASFSPVEGLVGQTVILTGEHLQTELIEGIKLGELNCEILSSNSQAVTVRVPADATTDVFQINTKGGEALSSSAYTVWYAPSITSLSKNTDIVGASITITGDNFAADKTRNKVRFGTAMAEVLEASTQQLTVRVPEQAETGLLSVETPGGKAISATNFEVIPSPRFTAMQPTKGKVGTVVEITGKHFGIMGLQDKIIFNGKEALVLESAGNKYKVRVPRGASTGKVTITGYGGQARSSVDFVVEELAPAEAISVYPNPNSGQFNVSLRHADFDVQQMEVYDALGKRLHQMHITGPRPEAVDINLANAKPGLYFLQIQTERGTITKKLTVL